MNAKTENIIDGAINSESVQNVAKNSRLKDQDVWSLFFDSGCDYLDQLQHRMHHGEIFAAQFGELSIRLSPNETFKRILVAPYFWNWWSTQLWRVCYNFSNESKDEIYIRLKFNTSLIPQSTLEKIFANEKHQKISKKQTGMSHGIKHRTQQVC